MSDPYYKTTRPRAEALAWAEEMKRRILKCSKRFPVEWVDVAEERSLPDAVIPIWSVMLRRGANEGLIVEVHVWVDGKGGITLLRAKGWDRAEMADLASFLSAYALA